MDVSAGERVREVVGHEPEQLLRAWLRGDHHPDAVDVELLDDPDVTMLAASLRECVTDGCLDVAAVRSVFDLVVHVARPPHDVVRLGDRTVRALGLLTQMHARNAKTGRMVITAANEGLIYPRVDDLIRTALRDAGCPLSVDELLAVEVHESLVDAVVHVVDSTPLQGPEEIYDEDIEVIIRERFTHASEHDRVFRCRDGRLVHGEYRADPDVAPWGGWCVPVLWAGHC